MNQFQEAKENLTYLRKQAKEEETDWNKTLELFKNRFYVPFEIETTNKDDVILNQELPAFKYVFKDKANTKELKEDNLLNVLSTGEKRAYYILNIIFRILIARRDDKEKLIIFDDISESFDYKNKYAVIEFIEDISKFKTSKNTYNFNMILLTHNFDFYRTVASRLTGRNNAFIASSDDGNISLRKAQYIRNVFKYFKSKIINNKNIEEQMKFVVASIPFVRNLIEFTKGEKDEDYLKLTAVLHIKEPMSKITYNEIIDIFLENWIINAKNITRSDESIFSVIDRIASNINAEEEKIDIEDKLILSIAIRLKTEKYLIDKLMALSDSNLRNEINSINGHQTRCLIDLYKEYFNPNKNEESFFEHVSMITPENIHLNSFMFEPILDMSLKELYNLYQKSRNLTCC